MLGDGGQLGWEPCPRFNLTEPGLVLLDSDLSLQGPEMRWHVGPVLGAQSPDVPVMSEVVSG